MMILVKLLLAHLVGDFILQPRSWVRAKEEKKLRAWQLYVHLLIHGILIVVLMPGFLPWALVLIVAHGIIDVAKLYFQQQHNRRGWFFLDQLLHLLSILAVAVAMGTTLPSWEQCFTPDHVLLLTMVCAITFPACVFIEVFISHWGPQFAAKKEAESLSNAGKYIGILERLFVFTFIVTDHWEAVGFLLATKSVFRFGDLKEAKDRKLTEYVLIGSLVSFGTAIFAGLGYLAWSGAETVILP